VTGPAASRPTLAVTGVDGFVGRHVAAVAAGRGWEVVGLSRAEAPDAGLARHLQDYHSVDLRREWPRGVEVDAVIHLAGLAAVGPSFANPQEYIEVNSAITTTICESILTWSRKRPVRVIGVSSGAVYRPPAHDGTGVDESAPVSASSPYVVSKLLVEHQLAYYATRGIDTIVARPFNHIGPGQGPGFLLPDLARALLALPPGAALSTGDLTTERDYTDVRDVARAYVLLASASRHEHFVYNVASGRSRTGREILEGVAEALTVGVPELEVDHARVRANDPRRVIGSASRLRDEFAWTPDIPIDQSIADFTRGLTADA
jgi:GDP-4-dehydro-6-deoxy-D-mannose reductase